MESAEPNPDERRQPAGTPSAGDSAAARAEAAIRAIAAGADPGAEALSVSNRFTDDVTQRVRASFRRRERPKRRDDREAGSG